MSTEKAPLSSQKIYCLSYLSICNLCFTHRLQSFPKSCPCRTSLWRSLLIVAPATALQGTAGEIPLWCTSSRMISRAARAMIFEFGMGNLPCGPRINARRGSAWVLPRRVGVCGYLESNFHAFTRRSDVAGVMNDALKRAADRLGVVKEVTPGARRARRWRERQRALRRTQVAANGADAQERP
jgi:hypothetical protein